MAVDLVTQMWSRKKGGVASQDGRTFTFTQSDGFQVTTTTDGTLSEIVSHPDIPKVGQALSGAPFITVKSVTPTQVSPIYWVIDVQSTGEAGGSDPSSSPIDNTPTIKVSTVESEAEIDEDADGNPIVTTNNEPITGVKKKIYDLGFTITRNFLAVNDELANQYLDSVNSDTFLGFAAGRVKMTGYTYDIVFSDSLTYYKVTGNFLARTPYNTTAEKAWYSRSRHEGFYEKVGTSVIRAVDDDGQPVTKPVLLAEDGTRITDPANTFWKEIKRYQTLPYNALGFL